MSPRFLFPKTLAGDLMPDAAPMPDQALLDVGPDVPSPTAGVAADPVLDNLFRDIQQEQKSLSRRYTAVLAVRIAAQTLRAEGLSPVVRVLDDRMLLDVAVPGLSGAVPVVPGQDEVSLAAPEISLPPYHFEVVMPGVLCDLVRNLDVPARSVTFDPALPSVGYDPGPASPLTDRVRTAREFAAMVEFEPVAKALSQPIPAPADTPCVTAQAVAAVVGGGRHAD